MSKKSVLDVDDLTVEDIRGVFERAAAIKRSGFSLSPSLQYKLVALMFFEDSTRTRVSFEIASQRLGLRTCLLEEAGSSIAKGETLLDTFYNVSAMRPDLIVVRFGEDKDLDAALKKSSIPVISAGQGKAAHVTQAMLDAFTIQESFGEIKGKRVAIVGDVLHSRVAASNIRLLARLGAEVAVFGPEEFTDLPEDLASKTKKLKSMDDLVGWADVVMALRIQMERLSASLRAEFSTEQFIARYGIRVSTLSKMQPNGILMHPGPVNVGVELDREVMNDRRSRILQQTENGVFIRAALIERILG
jgi:aspartate carbamoyltransferase catalytic subunit